MLKSTKMKIENELERNSLNRERNDIERERIFAELKTANLNAAERNRVDISLKQYNEMCEHIKTLESELSSTKSQLDRFLKPFVETQSLFDYGLSSDRVGYFCKCISNNENIENIRVAVNFNPVKQTDEIAYIFEIERKL